LCCLTIIDGLTTNFAPEPFFVPLILKSLVRRATELQVDLDALTSGEIPPLVGQKPYTVFTLDEPGCLTREQRQWVNQLDCEVKREYVPAEVLYERIEGDTQAHRSNA